MKTAIIVTAGLVAIALIWLISHAEELYDGDETLTEYQAQWEEE